MHAVFRPVLPLLLLSMAACEPGPAPDSGDLKARDLATLRAGTPLPEDLAALSASVDRHYPPALAAVGATASVLLDVHVSADGRVRGVEVVPPVADDSRDSVVVVVRDAATGRTVDGGPLPAYDPAFAEPARDALREVRFHPARRNGKPRDGTLRMTIVFAPPRTS